MEAARARRQRSGRSTETAGAWEVGEHLACLVRPRRHHGSLLGPPNARTWASSPVTLVRLAERQTIGASGWATLCSVRAAHRWVEVGEVASRSEVVGGPGLDGRLQICAALPGLADG